MARSIIEFTAGAGRYAGSTVYQPNVWQAVGLGPCTIEYKDSLQPGDSTIFVNTITNDMQTARKLNPAAQIFETGGRVVYVIGGEGSAIIFDDGG